MADEKDIFRYKAQVLQNNYFLSSSVQTPFVSTLISSSELTKPSIWFELQGYNFEVLELVLSFQV